MTIRSYGFWRSLATFRVRAALNFKNLDYTEEIIDLTKGEQFEADFHQLNPQHVLPVLEHDALRLTQSLPIIEYIDEIWPDAPLLPQDPAGSARVRALAQMTSADVHPLIVPRVRAMLENEYGIDEAGRLKWIRHWFDVGSAAIEARLEGDGASGRMPTATRSHWPTSLSCRTWSVHAFSRPISRELHVSPRSRIAAWPSTRLRAPRPFPNPGMIPLSEAHLRSILGEWVVHYNGGRPHSALGPGVPGPPAGSARAANAKSRRLWTPGALVRAKSVLDGLHHEYTLWSTPALR